MSKVRKHLSPATVLAGIAVFFALTGGAYAIGKNSVGTKQIKNNAVTAAKIKKNAVTGAKIKANAVTGAKIKNGSISAAKIADKAVTGAKVDVTSFPTVPTADRAASADSVAGHETFPITRIVATDGADQDAAREAAPEVKLFEKGPITIYAKCFTNTTSNNTYGYFFIKTSENGVLFDSDDDEATGDPSFLNTDTPENDRVLMYDNTGANSSSIYFQHSDETVVMTPNGLSFEARHSIAVKNGTLANGNGIYGDGNVCLVTGDLTVYGS